MEQHVAEFTERFYGAVIEQERGDHHNVFASPLSLFVTMIMMLIGSRGNTRREIASALTFPERLNEYSILTAIRDLSDVLTSSTNIDVSLASRVYTLKNLQVKWQFVYVLRRYLDSDLIKLGLAGSVDVKMILNKMGIRDLFSSRSANLSRITRQEPLFVSNMFHKAVLKVDEKGATAAAATAPAMVLMSASSTPNFVVDHPFLVDEKGATAAAATAPAMVLMSASSTPNFVVDHPFLVMLVYNRTIPAFVGHCLQPEPN
ncbi:uncharacterized protein DEA37_0011456 [Paragonimus westermani]|uniref:Serpin domain-containing protein n=1 Tax=Paragonimus westermani TaxID=34504 RepID=A0A5J4N878_9TREM|nr:uncharacterized protein DEA37_0011456 [Paragonimus westermani]